MLPEYIEGSIRAITIGLEKKPKTELEGCYGVCKEEYKELEYILDYINEKDYLYEEAKKDYEKLTAAINYYDNKSRQSNE